MTTSEGEKGPPLNRSGLVPIEVGGEGETAADQGGGDAPLGRRKASWEEQVQAEEERRLEDNPQRKSLPPPPRSLVSASITTPPVAPSTSDGGFITVQGRKSRDKRPRDPSKDPTPRRRPSKASRLPLPFPLKNKAERVASIHTLFEAAIGQNRPPLDGSMTASRSSFPARPRSSWYTSAMCCVSPSLSFTSPLHAPLWACVPLCCCQLWRPNYHHWRIISMRTNWSHKTSASAV